MLLSGDRLSLIFQRMGTTRSKPAKPKAALGKSGEMYRGVRLSPVKTTKRFTAAQIKKAVKTAIKKNIDAIARKD